MSKCEIDELAWLRCRTNEELGYEPLGGDFPPAVLREMELSDRLDAINPELNNWLADTGRLVRGAKGEQV